MAAQPVSVQTVRAVLAHWTANDWRRGFALAYALENTLRRTCGVHDHEPLLNGAGALAVPVRTRLGQLAFPELLVALAPLALRLEARLGEAAVGRPGDVAAALRVLEAQEDIGPGLAKLAACRLGLEPSIAVRPFGPVPAPMWNRAPAGRSSADATAAREAAERGLAEALAELRKDQPLVIEAANRLVADAESGRSTGEDDLAIVSRWNQGLAHAASLAGPGEGPCSLASLGALLAERVQASSDEERGASLRQTLLEITEAAVTDGARVVLAAALEEAAAGAADPDSLGAERRDAFLALHRLLSLPSWEVDDAEVEVVEVAFGRRVARVAVAELAIELPPCEAVAGG